MELDDAYANLPYIPGAERYLEDCAAKAQNFREDLVGQNRAYLGLRYGKSGRQKYDLFHAKGKAKGLCIFVHGGYWLKFDRSLWSHFATGPLAQGWNVAIPSYDLCPTVKISDITRQIARSVEAVAGLTEGPIALVGHSAGGHLVARMCAPGMLSDDVIARISHVMPISPVSDLRPLLQTSMNADFQLDLASATAESPALSAPPSLPVTVWVGGGERPVFLDQARWLAESWNTDLVVTPGDHHLNVIEPLTDSASDMVARLLG